MGDYRLMHSIAQQLNNTIEEKVDDFYDKRIIRIELARMMEHLNSEILRGAGENEDHRDYLLYIARITGDISNSFLKHD